MSNKRIQQLSALRRMRSSLEIKQREEMSRARRASDLSHAAAGLTISTCRIPINNAGEARVVFTFSCKYTQLPNITFGYEMHSTPTPGRIPIFSASVFNFKTEDKVFSRVYTGADLLIVAESTPDISFVVVATASGIACAGPMEA